MVLSGLSFNAALWSWWTIVGLPLFVIFLVLAWYKMTKSEGPVSLLKRITAAIVVVVSFATMAWAADTKLSAFFV